MRYIWGLFVTIGLLILLIIILVRGGGNKTVVPSTAKSLISYADTNAEVRMTIDGQINADSIHRQIRITVNRDNVNYEVLQGYNGRVITSQHFSNTGSSYNSFLHALSHAGYTRGKTDKAFADEKGYCPLGKRYIFELSQDNDQIERFWTSTCGKPKTYLGNSNLTVDLFEAQVPGFAELSQKVEF